MLQGGSCVDSFGRIH